MRVIFMKLFIYTTLFCIMTCHLGYSMDDKEVSERNIQNNKQNPMNIHTSPQLAEDKEVTKEEMEEYLANIAALIGPQTSENNKEDREMTKEEMEEYLADIAALIGNGDNKENK